MFHSDIELQAWERLQGVPKKIDLSHGTHGSAEAPALLKVGNLSLPHAASDHICEQGVPILYAQWSFGLRFTYATPVPITCSCLKVSTKRLDRGPRAALVRALAAGRAERYRAGAAGADAAERGDSGARRRRGEGTGAGGDNGIAEMWNRREISANCCYDQSHDLHPHPYVGQLRLNARRQSGRSID
jgi:hypothetical protein